MPSTPWFAPFLLAPCIFASASGRLTATDPSGNVWSTGQTNFVLPTANAFQKTNISTVCTTENPSPFDPPHAVYCQHAFLTKQDPSGNVLYATYLGGSSQDAATAITTDAQGNVYVTGYTYSPDFPVTPGALQTKNAGPLTPQSMTALGAPFGPKIFLPGGDAFVAKFAPDGTILFSTLLGGAGNDIPTLIAADAAGSAYVSGATASTDFPVTARTQPASTFFARLNPTGTALTYSTYSAPSILAFDIDNQGRAYLTGNLPGPYITVLDTAAGTQSQSTFPIAGAGVAIAVLPSRNVYLAVSPASRQLGASTFLALSPDATTIVTKTAVAQTQFDQILFDASGNAYAFGHGTGAIPATPVQSLALPCAPNGGSFVLESNPAGVIIAATYFRRGNDAAAFITSPGHIATSPTLQFDLTTQPAMNFACPENLASNVPGIGLAPGEIFVLTGAGLGPAQGVAAAPDATGHYPTSLAGVQVLFDSTPAPLLFVQANEIHAVAPFTLAGFPVLQVRNGDQSAALDAAIASFNLGIFAVNGQGAILNQDATVNTPANPAALGSIVSIYATGTGHLATPLADGQLTPIPPPYILTSFQPQVTFAGIPGTVLWSGSAPGLIAGVTQINVQLPTALPAGTPLNAVPVVLNLVATPSPRVFLSVKP